MADLPQIPASRLQALYEISRQINSQRVLSALLEDIMDHATALLGAEKGLILLKSASSGELEVRVARAMDRHNLVDAVAMSRSVIEKVEQEGEPVLLQNVPDIPPGKTSKSMILHKLKSIVCVPLMFREQLMGAIYLDTRDDSRFFQPDDVALLESFANLAAIAIENAQAYRQIEELNIGLEKKVEERTNELRTRNEQLSEAYRELREAQLQLIRSEKLASLGQLVAGIAHEVNTPLGSLNSSMDVFLRGFRKIRGHLAAVTTAPEEVKRAQQMLEMLETTSSAGKAACDRISLIIKALRNFARLDEEEFKAVDLHQGLESSLILLEHRFRDRVEIIRNYGVLPPVRCRAAEINQVFMNLLANACEAIPDKGNITITTRQEGDNCLIEIADDGAGIPESEWNRIFDPGYTTKGVGVGLGLGLSICYRIMEAHGGTIKMYSRPGQGSRFTTILPIEGKPRR